MIRLKYEKLVTDRGVGQVTPAVVRLAGVEAGVVPPASRYMQGQPATPSLSAQAQPATPPLSAQAQPATTPHSAQAQPATTPLSAQAQPAILLHQQLLPLNTTTQVKEICYFPSLVKLEPSLPRGFDHLIWSMWGHRAIELF